MFRHLQVLDMEYRLNHESIPLNEEKQMVRDIKRLHSQRPRVRQFEAMAAEQEQTRAAARAAPQAGPNLGEMEQERKVRRCAGLWRSTAEVLWCTKPLEVMGLMEGLGEACGTRASGVNSESWGVEAGVQSGLVCRYAMGHCRQLWCKVPLGSPEREWSSSVTELAAPFCQQPIESLGEDRAVHKSLGVNRGGMGKEAKPVDVKSRLTVLLFAQAQHVGLIELLLSMGAPMSSTDVLV